MALNVTQVHRNLAQRVTFLGLEFEDLFVVLGLAAFTNIFCRFLDREMFGMRSLLWAPSPAAASRSSTWTLFNSLRIPGPVIDAIAEREQQELDRQEREYRGERPAPNLQDCTVILVDDGWLRVQLCARP
jgi:hypothetical protein